MKWLNPALLVGILLAGIVSVAAYSVFFTGAEGVAAKQGAAVTPLRAGSEEPRPMGDLFASLPPTEISPEPEPVAAPVPAGSAWRYEEDVDRMSGKATRFAFLESVNQIALGFPYEGYNQPRLMLRRRGKEVAAMLSVTQGQIMCEIGGCAVKVKFDDHAPVRYEGDHPADYDSTKLFLSPGGQLAARIGKSKTMLVEVTLFQSGTHVLEFDVSGLKWPR